LYRHCCRLRKQVQKLLWLLK